MKSSVLCVLIFCSFISKAQNQLLIPPVLSGLSFNLNVQQGTQVFYGNTATPTYGINGDWMAPTIIVNKGDSVTLNVINNLPVRTTMHWHGLHVAAMNDGGPHQIIDPGETWSPGFKIRNNASTFWYHPHGLNQTEQQVSKGLAGLLIVKDDAEASLNLPRTYGTDDIPLIIQSKAFDDLTQIAIATDMDTSLFVNGTLNPVLDAPAQVVRFRLLNAGSLRSYYLGFTNNQTFYQIATDGGLLDSSRAISRLLLSPGERAEILIDFAGMLGQDIEMKSFASELPAGIYGAETVGLGEDTIPEYQFNYLNGSDFNLLDININSVTSVPVTVIPASLVPFVPFEISAATNYRTIVMDTFRLLSFDSPNLAEGPFGLNNATFNMDIINEVVHLNTTEIWTLKNNTLIAHPFHIHDIQFNVIEEGGLPVPANEKGFKDVVLVMPGDSVKFITRFDTFADNVTPYMYHCHLLHHEDDGMMGSFVVVDTTTGIADVNNSAATKVFPNPASSTVYVEFPDFRDADIVLFNVLGEIIVSKRVNDSQNLNIDLAAFNSGIYFLQIKSNTSYSTHKIVKQ